MGSNSKSNILVAKSKQESNLDKCVAVYTYDNKCKKLFLRNELYMYDNNWVHIFTDGSTRRNGKDNAVSTFAVHF